MTRGYGVSEAMQHYLAVQIAWAAYATVVRGEQASQRATLVAETNANSLGYSQQYQTAFDAAVEAIEGMTSYEREQFGDKLFQALTH